MYVEVRDPRQTLLLEHDLVEEGQFGFTSVVSGEHQVCVIAAPSASYYGGAKLLRCQLTMDFGEQAVDYSSIAKAEHLSAIEVEVRKLGDKVRAIRQEQDYQKSRESDYRDHSESINASVMYWSIAQTALLIAAGLAQLYLLTKFFKVTRAHTASLRTRRCAQCLPLPSRSPSASLSVSVQAKKLA